MNARNEFFKKALTDFRSVCAQQGIAVAERKFLVYLQSLVPTKKWTAWEKHLDRSAADLPHHKKLDFNPRRDPAVIKSWLQSRYVFMFGKPICATCGSAKGPMFDFDKVGTGFKNLWFTYCSESCSKGSEEATAKRKATSLKKYGAANVAQSKHFKKKMQGYWDQFDEEQRLARNAKREATLIAQHGSVRKANLARAKLMVKTNMERYGGPAATCSPAVRAKVEATNLRVRGVRNPSQDPTVMEKINNSWRKRKSLKIKGVTFKGLQGYEPQVIKHLVRKGVPPSCIMRPDFGVSYTYKGKERVYHPDFLIKLNDKECLVEVKSLYTAALRKDVNASHGYGEYRMVRAKINACVDLGYLTRLAVWAPGGCLFWKNKLPRDRSKVLKEFTLRVPS